MRLQEFYINGKWQAPIGEPQLLPVINPGTEKAVGEVALGSVADLNAAVIAARSAFSDWCGSSIEERQALLEALLSVYNRRIGEMGEAISTEMGAPIDLALKSQAPCGPWHLRGFIDALQQMHWQQQNHNDLIVSEPVGVCGADYAMELAYESGCIKSGSRTGRRLYDGFKTIGSCAAFFLVVCGICR